MNNFLYKVFKDFGQYPSPLVAASTVSYPTEGVACKKNIVYVCKY